MRSARVDFPWSTWAIRLNARTSDLSFIYSESTLALVHSLVPTLGSLFAGTP
jgi:hypothetical protein